MRILSRVSGYRYLKLSVALALIGLLTIALVPQLRWRAHLLGLHLTGRIPDIELPRLLSYMWPGSAPNISRLIETRNPYPVISNPRTTPDDIIEGGRRFLVECATCHAPNGAGGEGGPSLIGSLQHGDSDWAIFRTVRYGVSNTAMLPHPMGEDDVWRIISYMRTFRQSQLTTEPGYDLPEIQVPYEELASIREPSGDWLTYSGSYTSSRHSLLTQITPENVGQLGLRWIHQFAGDPGVVEASPLVRSGIMFTTIPPATILALDAGTGKQVWRYAHPLRPNVAGGEFGVLVNRGVALLDDQVFIGTMDAKLVAVAAGTGALRWETEISTDPETYYISSAPLAYGDLVVTGVGTREGGRAFVVAYDARSGEERWRWIAIPGPGEPGNETWSGDSWREGGAPTWLTGSYDPELDLLIWLTGNPKPDYEGDKRRGDNLYSNSVVGLRGSTGEFLWHFQFTPADDHDWDANQIPVLAEYESTQGIEKRVLVANRNGFYYVLDAPSGEFLRAVSFVRQTWAAGLDRSGRPILAPNTEHSDEGTLLYPGNVGATNWWSPSFDPELDLIFVPSLEQGMLYFGSDASWPIAPAGEHLYTAVRALNATTGAMVWEDRNPPRISEPSMGGLLSTTSGVVFGGDLQRFFALDSRTGARLWSVETGGRIHAAPVTYQVGAEQFVVIAAGGSLLSFALPSKPN